MMNSEAKMGTVTNFPLLLPRGLGTLRPEIGNCPHFFSAVA